MSRIDEALRRARTTTEPAPGQPSTADEPPRTSDNPVFESAWTLPDAAPPLASPVRARPEPPVVETGAPGTLAVFQGFSPAIKERLALPANESFGLVEQFRRLAATLHHTQTDRGIKCVMVTSAMAGEGKTLTATNLALTLSESYRRNVLLVDADLRRPSLHSVFQVANVSGLSDGLQAPKENRLALVQISPLLTVLTAGRPDPDPMHLLISKRMQEVLHEASTRFDWVILDTPPVGLLTDANLLSAMVDAALLVVRVGTTPYQSVERAVDAIGRERIVGVVLNGANETGPQDGYYDYRYAGYHQKGQA
jgi:capsular exopolysaccharide synthesis family protein